jgi:hypothetical protein
LTGSPRSLLKGAECMNLPRLLRPVQRSLPWWVILIGLSVASARGQSQPAPGLTPQASAPASPNAAPAGSISGTVVDPSGAVIPNVKVSLAVQGFNANKETLSDTDGHFFFTDVVPGPFQITFTASGFASLKQSGILQAGENFVVPQIALGVARASVDVEVTESPAQVAEDELKVEEKQRVLGFIPNYYVTYVPHPVALTPRLKFQLAWKSIINPYTFGITGGIAGIEQAENTFSGYGQGAQGVTAPLMPTW